MRLTSLSLGALTLLLLIAVPVNAAPVLHTGSQTRYNLSVSISILQFLCTNSELNSQCGNCLPNERGNLAESHHQWDLGMDRD